LVRGRRICILFRGLVGQRKKDLNSVQRTRWSEEEGSAFCLEDSLVRGRRICILFRGLVGQRKKDLEDGGERYRASESLDDIRKAVAYDL
jgi:hypothetical protein